MPKTNKKRHLSAPTKETPLSRFKVQYKGAYEQKYPDATKSTLNAIILNDFKLPGVKELFSQDGIVEGYELPDYSDSSVSTLERKGFASVLAKAGDPVPEEIRKSVQQPIKCGSLGVIKTEIKAQVLNDAPREI